MKKLKLTEVRGLSQLYVLIGMLLLAVSLPLATRLVQQNQENRSSAASTTTYACSNNETKCIGTGLYVCNASRTGWSLKTAGASECSTTTTCTYTCTAWSSCKADSSSLTGGTQSCNAESKSPTGCTGGSSKVGTTRNCSLSTTSTYYIYDGSYCISAGSYNSAAACKSAKGVTCYVSLSACSAAYKIETCTAGTKKCIGSYSYTCNTDGYGWNASYCGAGCDSSTGKCKTTCVSLGGMCDVTCNYGVLTGATDCTGSTPYCCSDKPTPTPTKAGSGGGGGSSSSTSTTLKLLPSTLTLKVGESAVVAATNSVKWVTSSEAIATVVSTGVGSSGGTTTAVVTGVSVGDATITATSTVLNKKTKKYDTATVAVSVVAEDVSGLLSFKVSFAGIKPSYVNASGESYSCIGSLGSMGVEVLNRPTNTYQSFSGVNVSVVGNEVDSKGNQIFQVSNLDVGSSFASTDNFNYVKIKGPFHLKRRMCKDGQTGKLDETTTCEIDLKRSDSYVYDFSEYTLLAGDVDQNGVINSLDFSLVKGAVSADAEPECGKQYDLNMDGVVNSLDLNLVKDSLSSIDDE